MNNFKNLWEVLKNTSSQTPNAIYLKSFEVDMPDLSYSETLRFSESLNQYFDEINLPQDAKILTILPNSSLMALLTIGTMCGTRCLVPINPSLLKGEVQYIVDLIEPEVIIHTNIDLIDLINTDAKTIDINKDFFNMVLSRNTRGYLSRSSEDDLAEIVFTSGSTGSPKGVMISQKNILSNSFSLAERYGYTESSKLLTVVPLFHTGGQIATTVAAIWFGSSVTIVPTELALFSFWELVEKYQINWTVTLTTFLSVLLSRKSSKLKGNTLKGILAGGSCVSSELIESFEHEFDVSVYQIYGMTETTSISISRDLNDTLMPLHSVGLPVGSCNFNIIDEQGNPLPKYEIGEISLSGDNVFLGYFDQKEMTDLVLNDESICTGDIGYFDDNNYLYVIDRKDNLIISGGGNIYPA